MGGADAFRVWDVDVKYQKTVRFVLRSNRTSCAFRSKNAEAILNQNCVYAKGECLMFPVINKRETGINLRRIMDMRGVSAKHMQQ